MSASEISMGGLWSAATGCFFHSVKSFRTCSSCEATLEITSVVTHQKVKVEISHRSPEDACTIRAVIFEEGRYAIMVAFLLKQRPD